MGNTEQPTSSLSPIRHVVDSSPCRQENIGGGLHRVFTTEATKKVGKHIGLLLLVQRLKRRLPVHNDLAHFLSQHPYMSDTGRSLSTIVRRFAGWPLEANGTQSNANEGKYPALSRGLRPLYMCCDLKGSLQHFGEFL